MSESALVVLVPAAEPCVGALRLRYDPVARLGMPAHVTLLHPFVDPREITAAIVDRVRGALANVRAFAFRLDEIARFPETIWLAPEPATPFIALTEALAAAFPSHPPYGGRFPTIVPHLTVAHVTGDGSAMENELRGNLQRLGPVASTCSAVDLMDDTSGTWRLRHHFALRT